jgi:hypothetical protein
MWFNKKKKKKKYSILMILVGMAKIIIIKAFQLYYNLPPYCIPHS